MKPRFDIEVQLTGKDGNAFALMGEVTRGMRKAGATPGDINEFRNEAMDGDYDHLLQTCMRWVNVT